LLVLLAIAPAGFAASQSPLVDAAERQNHSALQQLLRGKNADVNEAQADGMTALHWAAYLEDERSADLLLRARASVNVTNRYGITPLYLACLNGSSAIVDRLLQAGADPNTKVRGGETLLMTAARTGRPPPVKSLLARGVDVNAKERRGQTALMWTAAEGNTEVVELLIEAGADIHAILPDSGFTPLFFAVREGRTGAALALLKAGADVNGTMEPRKPHGKGPRPGTSPLLLAVENGHFELAISLLERGADPNDQRSGYTALHTITWVRKPNRGDGDDGDPAPIGSGNLSTLQFVEKLVAYGADVNARLEKGSSGRGQLSRKGATPLLLAAFTDDAPLMRLLVSLGADPFIPNADGATPLMAAAGLGVLAPTEEAGTEEEAIEAVELALDLGLDINTVDKNRETAMHGAAYKNFPKVVEFLAARGADIGIWNRTNRWGWTPLRIAEGYRPGNFKPSAETVAALHRVMLAAGVTPPSDQIPATASGPDYQQPVAGKKNAQ